MRGAPATAMSPSADAIWLTTPLPTVTPRPHGYATTQTSSPSETSGRRRTGGTSCPR